MKKLLLLSVVLFALAGCSKDETTSPGQADQSAAFAPHFYGAAMLENPAPETRGVANALKVWSKPMAANNLTVKFLNGSDRYKEYVMEVAKEWEKAAGVRFHFVGSDKAAVIRVGFDYVPGMMSSWALTGTDHMQVYGQQTEATVHFAQWRRASDAQKRSDVLRAFGQVLGLELEFRHPNFYPAWITNADGTVNEVAIKEYWENELADYITWPELKKIVLDPLTSQTFFITQTDEYDQKSVMCWPFYDWIARNIPPIEFDENYNTQLSENDKAFVQSLYGESFGGTSRDEEFFPLIEFEYTGTNPYFNVTTTKNLEVRWDYQITNECTRYDLPTDTTSFAVVPFSYTFAEAKTRKIVIGEVLEYGQTKPDFSTALTKFDFTGANYAGVIDFKGEVNKALSYVRIIGGPTFTSREFNFTGNQVLKELYLVQTLDSRVTVDNCQNLEVLATSRYVWRPKSVTGPRETTVVGIPVDSVYTATDGPIAIWPDTLIYIVNEWPEYPEKRHSLSDVNGQGVTILNCNKLKTISLENTRIKNLNFSNLPNLEYIYLSSRASYIVGGSLLRNDNGQYLENSFNTLNTKLGTPGIIVLRGVHTPVEGVLQPFYPPFVEVRVHLSRLNGINTTTTNKNWTIVWDSGCEPFVKIKPPYRPTDELDSL